EFVRLSLPVQINEYLIDELEKNARWEEVKRKMVRIRLEKEKAGYLHSAGFEQQLVGSGFSVSDVKDLQRTYSDGEGDEGVDLMNQQQGTQIGRASCREKEGIEV